MDGRVSAGHVRLRPAAAAAIVVIAIAGRVVAGAIRVFKIVSGHEELVERIRGDHESRGGGSLQDGGGKPSRDGRSGVVGRRGGDHDGSGVAAVVEVEVVGAGRQQDWRKPTRRGCREARVSDVIVVAARINQIVMHVQRARPVGRSRPGEHRIGRDVVRPIQREAD